MGCREGAKISSQGRYDHFDAVADPFQGLFSGRINGAEGVFPFQAVVFFLFEVCRDDFVAALAEYFQDLDSQISECTSQ